MIKFTCSSCNKSISVDDRHAGKKGNCPQCGTAVVVPARSTVIEFHCGSCGRRIKVPGRYAGRKGKCPTCQKPVVVPALQEEPVTQSEGATITCAMCGQTVGVTEGSPEPTVECPECGSALNASLESVLPGAEVAVPSEADEDLYEAPAGPETSRGPDRPLLIFIGGAVAVLVAGVIGLFIFLRGLGSGPAAEPVSPPPRRDITQTETQARPVVAEPVVAEPTTPTPAPAPVTPAAIRLQFRPHPGAKRTMRVTTRLAMTSQSEGQALDITNTQSVTFDLEALDAQADGRIPVQITLAVIQVKTQMPGMPPGGYDSAKPQSEHDPMAGIYVPFVGKRFTIGVSGQGEVIDPGLDELFLAVATDRVAAEDDMMREQLKERAKAAIEQTNRRYGSREKRALALKQQLEESPLFGAEEVRSLLDDLITSLPEEPMQSGMRWEAPVVVRVGTRLEIPGAYAVTAIDDDSCTISGEGTRSQEEEPFIHQSESTIVNNKLGGSSQANLTVDRQTGWLLSKEQTTTLSGRISRTNPKTPGKESFSDVSMELTTTVALVEWREE